MSVKMLSLVRCGYKSKNYDYIYRRPKISNVYGEKFILERLKKRSKKVKKDVSNKLVQPIARQNISKPAAQIKSKANRMAVKSYSFNNNFEYEPSSESLDSELGHNKKAWYKSKRFKYKLQSFFEKIFAIGGIATIVGLMYTGMKTSSVDENAYNYCYVPHNNNNKSSMPSSDMIADTIDAGNDVKYIKYRQKDSVDIAKEKQSLENKKKLADRDAASNVAKAASVSNIVADTVDAGNGVYYINYHQKDSANVAKDVKRADSQQTVNQAVKQTTKQTAQPVEKPVGKQIKTIKSNLNVQKQNTTAKTVAQKPTVKTAKSNVENKNTSKKSAIINQSVTNQGVSYTVKKGDNLWKIVKSRYMGMGVKKPSNALIQRTVDKTIELNKLTNPDVLNIGMQLQLPPFEK